MSDRDLVRWIVAKFEGSRYVDHPQDRGGPTRWGVTQALLSQFMKRDVSKDEVRTMPLDLAIDVLHSTFVHAPKFYQIDDPLVRLCAVDFSIHSGAVRGVRSLQYAAFPGPPYDGLLGPITATAVNRANPDQLRRDMLAYRIRFIGKLITAKPSQATFASGWANRIATLLELEPGETLARAA